MSPDSREAEVLYGNRTLPGSRESGDEASPNLLLLHEFWYKKSQTEEHSKLTRLCM